MKFDDTTGIPTHDAEGEPLSKKRLKKLNRVYQQQCKKYEKWQESEKRKSERTDVTDAENSNNPDKDKHASAEAKSDSDVDDTASKIEDLSLEDGNSQLSSHGYDVSQKTYGVFAELEKSGLSIVAGTFGNRQGYKLDAEMGPFTHVFDFP